MYTLAFSTLACPQWTIEEVAQAASDYGYDAVEWRMANGQVISPELPASVRERLVAVASEHYLSTITLDTSCRLVQADERRREETLSEAEWMLQLAHDLGAPAIRVFGGDPPEGTTMEDAISAAAATLRAIAGLAAPVGVRILLETHDRLWSHSAHVHALLKTVAMPNCGIIWDIYHTFRSDETPDRSAQALSPFIASVHFKDGRHTEQGWQLCLPGEGDIPLGEVIAALRAINYQGPFCFEWEKHWHPELAPPEVALPAGKKVMQDMLLEH